MGNCDLGNNIIKLLKVPHRNYLSMEDSLSHNKVLVSVGAFAKT
jgi:hypothetical protein